MLSDECKAALRAWVDAIPRPEEVEELCAQLRRGEGEAAELVAEGLEDAARERDGVRERVWAWTRERSRG